MDSDDGGHSENEFYYPEEETLNQMTPILISFPTLKIRNPKKDIYVIYRARSVRMGKDCGRSLEYSRPRAYKFFSHMDLPPGK